MAVTTRKQDYDVKFKILLLGESSVGKTSIIRKLIGSTFNMAMMPTVGIDFERRTYNIKERKVQLEIWDTAGQERFRTISAFHYRNAKGMIVVYDVTNSVTFQRMKTYWLESIDDKVTDAMPVPVVLVGNKVDLDDKRQVTKREAEQVSERRFAHGYFETSALSGANIEELFEHVANLMVNIWGLPPVTGENGDADPLGRRKSIKLHEKDLLRKKSTSSCCSSG